MANKLGYELENCAGINGVKHKYGGEGNCNSSIFNNISLKSEKFKKDDIVIIEWTTMERFKWVNDIDNCMSTILPNQFDGPFDVNVLENVLVNRSHYLWVNELFVKLTDPSGLEQTVAHVAAGGVTGEAADGGHALWRTRRLKCSRGLRG